MAKDRNRVSRLKPATPARPNRPLRTMPRQVREAPPPARERAANPRGRTFLGRAWPLPVSPVALVLVLLFAIAAGAAWYFEGRYETPPAEAAKQVMPYKAADVQTVELTSPDGKMTFRRGADGKMATDGPPPAPTPVPDPSATPGPVTFSPSARVESALTQIAELKVDRVLANEASTSADFGLDKPQMTVTLTPKQGAALALAIGKLNPQETAYYVRRDQRKDTILVSRYALDDLVKTVGDAMKQAQGG